MISQKITQFIGRHEGFVSKWYLDPTGTPTIGFGFTWKSRIFREWWMAKHGRKMRRGDTISYSNALVVFKSMLENEYFPPVRRAFSKRPQHVIEAAGSFVYNAGAGALSWKWAKAIVRGDIKEGARLWRQTATTSRGKRLPGLVRRRREEAEIAEFNSWPNWLNGEHLARVPNEDIKQAQIWLKTLGFPPGPIDGVNGVRTSRATSSFQTSHGNLKVDGVLGPATLSALQRAIDLKNKGIIVVGGGAASGGAGVGTSTVNADWGLWGDILLWGGLAVIVGGLIYLAVRYNDEIKTLVRKL